MGCCFVESDGTNVRVVCCVSNRKLGGLVAQKRNMSKGELCIHGRPAGHPYSLSSSLSAVVLQIIINQNKIIILLILT